MFSIFFTTLSNIHSFTVYRTFTNDKEYFCKYHLKDYSNNMIDLIEYLDSYGVDEEVINELVRKYEGDKLKAIDFISSDVLFENMFKL